MARIETWFNQDLKQAVKVRYLDGNVFSADNAGNIVGVNVFEDGQPATLGGSVSGSIIRADGATVAVVGTLSGNKASIVLPQAAYAVPGTVSIVIKLTNGSDITTLCAVVSNVYMSTTDSVVDPGTIIPSVETLIAEIEAAIASIPADYSTLWASLAPVFNASSSYKAGQYVTYDGGLYRFVVSHDAGSWDSSHVVLVALGNDVSFLSESIKNKSMSVLPSTPTGHGIYQADGTYDQDDGWDSYYIPVSGEAQYTVTFSGTSSPYNNLNEYAADGSFIKTHGRVGNYSFETTENTEYIGCAVLHREAGALDVKQLLIRGEIDLVKESVNAVSQHIDDNGVMTRYTFTNAKTSRNVFDVPANTAVYFRAVYTTNQTITHLSLYGINTGETAELLASQYFGGSISKFVTTKTYEYFQVALFPYPSGDFSGTVAYDILVSNLPGIEFDIARLQSGVITKNLNVKLARLFQKVVCCGDSYTEGYIWLDGDPARTIEPNYSWVHFMGLATGNNWVNCGSSGANVLTWQTNDNGYPKALRSGKAQAYTLGLLINDISTGERGVPLGTVSDIGTEAQTYYGGLSQIIRKLNAINDTAKIFVFTCPKVIPNHPYNQAIRDVVSAYENTYPVYCLDIAASDLFQNNPSFELDAMGGHYTGVGYEQMAEIIEYFMSKYIGDHVHDFQNVHKIPFDP